MALCKSCGAEIPDSTKFCTSCGAPMEAPQTPVSEQPAPPPAQPDYNQIPPQPSPVQQPIEQPVEQPAQPFPIQQPTGQQTFNQPPAPQPFPVQQPSGQQAFNQPPAPQPFPVQQPSGQPQFNQAPYGAPIQPATPTQPPKKKNNTALIIILAIVAVLVVALIAVFVVNASKGKNKPDPTNPTESDTVITDDTTVADETDENDETELPVGVDVAEPLFSIDGISASIQKTEVDDYDDFVVYFECKNDTADAVTFKCEYPSLMKCGFSDYFYCNVAAGKTGIEKLTFDAEDIDEYKITEFSEIGFTFSAYESESYEDLYWDEFVVYLSDKDPKDFDYPEYPGYPDTEYSVVETDEFDFYLISFYPGEYSYEFANVWVYIKNKTDKNLYFKWNDVSLNNMMCDPYWSEIVPAGCWSLSDVNFSESDLETIGITDFDSITELEFTLLIQDSDDWYADDYLNESFSVTIG